MSFITLLSCSNNIGRQITNTHRAYYVQTYFTVHNTLPSVYVNNNINNCISLLYIQYSLIQKDNYKFTLWWWPLVTFTPLSFSSYLCGDTCRCRHVTDRQKEAQTGRLQCVMRLLRGKVVVYERFVFNEQAVSHYLVPYNEMWLRYCNGFTVAVSNWP